MKKTKQIIMLLLMSAALSLKSNAQWLNPGGFTYGTTNLTTEVIGVGNLFPNKNTVRAKLHINAFYLPVSMATPVVNNGSVFQTDGDDAFDNTWLMLTGATALTTTEKMRLFVAAGSNDVTLQASYNNAGIYGNMYLNTFDAFGSNNRITVLGGNGHVGIGRNYAPGSDILDIKPGAALTNTGLGLYNYASAASATVLHNWGVRNIFVGAGAGVANIPGLIVTPGTGYDNAFFGFNAGTANTTGIENVFIGSLTGTQVSTEQRNTFVGCLAGQFFNSNILQTDNTFVGYLAGGGSGGSSSGGIHNTSIGDEAGRFTQLNNNTAIGAHANRNNFTGHGTVCLGYNAGNVNDADSNVYAGAHSGENSTIGMQNAFLGANSGFNNVAGFDNTFIGFNADCGVTTPALNNSSAIGSGATVLNNDKMILGANNVDVGIGLSGVLGGPTAKLQIQEAGTATPHLRLSQSYNTIWTDLQVRNTGDLYIHPSNNGTNSNVGINTTAPATTLEINSNDPLTNPGNSGLTFTDLDYNSTAVINNHPQKAVFSVNNAGKAILVFDEGGGTITSSCAIPWRLPKMDNPNTGNMVCSQVYDDGSTVTIGSYTNLNYKFEVTGTSAFSLQPNPTSFAYTYFGTNQYALIVKTATDGLDNLGGLAILSSASNTTPQDALHMYADDQNLVHFVNIGNNTVFRDKTTNGSLLGFIPNEHVTVVKEDFETNQTQGPHQSTFYAEAQWNNGNAHGALIKTNAIYGNNNWNDGLPLNVSTWNFTGVRGECTNVRVQPTVSNTGGHFEASGASKENTGARIISIGGNTETINYGARIWTGAAAEGISAPGPATWNYGTFSRVFYQTATGNFGGYFKAEDGRSNYGVWGEALNPSPNNFGGHFRADNGTLQNVAGKFEAYNGPGINYAVWAISNMNNCPPFPTPGCTQAAGYFQGQVFSSMGYFMPSDTLLKDSLIALPPNDTSLTNSITAYSYKYDTATYSNMSLPSGTHYGFSAEEVAAKFPNMVTELKQPAEYDSLGNIIHPELNFKAVNYIEFIALLWNGFQFMQQQMDSMKQVMTACCNLSPRVSNPSTNTGSIELQNLKSIQLEQNDPNPFVENSIIRWSIPTDFKQATILFFENSGSQINKYKIEQKGNGELQVFGSKLSSGVYTYTLVVDGKIIDSKKMVKAQ